MTRTITNKTNNNQDATKERTINMTNNNNSKQTYSPYTLNQLLNGKTFIIEPITHIKPSRVIKEDNGHNTLDPLPNWNNKLQVHKIKTWKINSYTTLEQLTQHKNYHSLPVRTKTGDIPLKDYIKKANENFPTNSNFATRKKYLNVVYVTIMAAIQQRNEKLIQHYQSDTKRYDQLLQQSIELVIQTKRQDLMVQKRDLLNHLLKTQTYSRTELKDIIQTKREAYLALAPIYEVELPMHRIDFKERTLLRILPGYNRWDEHAPKYNWEDFNPRHNTPGVIYGHVLCNRYYEYQLDLDEDIAILTVLYLSQDSEQFVRTNKYGEADSYDFTPAPVTDEEIYNFRNQYAQADYDHLIGHRDFGNEA